MTALALGTGLTACLLSFQLALDRHFIRSGKMPKAAFRIALLSTAVFLAAIVHLWSAGAPSAGFSIAAAVLLLASFSLFHVTRRSSPPRCLPVAFEDAAPERLVVEGPHKYVRHPFYVSYMLYWVAAFLSAPSLLVGLGSSSMILIYAVLAGREERELLDSPLGAAYEQYRRRTGRFLPRL
jgi:protein-S-isoprenylcysteine O-methyltransferase Ste14